MKGQQSADNTVRGPRCLLNKSHELSAQQMNVFKGMGLLFGAENTLYRRPPSYKIGRRARSELGGTR